MADPNCIFCKIARGDIPADKIFDDGVVVAIHDIAPKAPTHVLVIPHEHVEALASAADSLIAITARCLQAAPGIARELGVAEAGYRLVVNQGADAGQEVPHFHLHILAGRRLGAMG